MLKRGEIRRFRAWLQRLGQLFQDNRTLIESAEVPHYLKPIQLSLFDRDKYLIDGEECVDFFIQYDNLHQGIRDTCEKLDIPFEPGLIPALKKHRQMRPLPIEDFYDKQSRELVLNLYAWEISRFRYEIPG